FWGVRDHEINNSDSAKIDAAMIRTRDYAISQYQSVVTYMKSLGIDKPVHIGETGWTSQSNEFYGHNGSRAADEFKSGTYHDLMRAWTNKNNITCFYFEAFDEQWKDAANPQGSENHFGLINLQGQAKYALWDEVDKGVFKGLTRDGLHITKTYNGNKEALMKDVKVPPTLQDIKAKK
ncbi:MAG TPA: glycosyl hydrolase family 17 protein, partial [Saprospiraceae bacterium]|nr:glycosyl hydrolase family 17 protein [Saprospiraceae bacterium]